MVRAREASAASRYRWVVLGVAFLVHATAIALVWQSIPPLKKAIAADLAVTWDTAVVVFAAFSLGLVFTQVPGGALGDRFPVRYVVGFGAVLAGAATALRFAVPTLGGLVAASLVATVGMGLVNPNLIKVVTEWFPAEQLGLGQGVLMTGNTIGSGLALSLSAGVVLAAVGSWQNVFLLYGGVTVALGVVWLVLVRSPREEERPLDPATGLPFTTADRVPLRASLPAVFRAASTPWAVGFAALSFWAILGSLAVLPEFADGQPYAVGELLLGTPLYAATVGALVLPVVSDRVGRAAVLYAGVVGLAAGIVVTGFAPSLSVFVLGMALAGLFGGGLNAMLYVLPGELADIEAAHVGTMAGVVLSLGQVGGTASSIVGARVLSAVGVREAALVTAVPALLGVVCIGRLRLGGTVEAGGPSGTAADADD